MCFETWNHICIGASDFSDVHGKNVSVLKLNPFRHARFTFVVFYILPVIRNHSFQARACGRQIIVSCRVVTAAFAIVAVAAATAVIIVDRCRRHRCCCRSRSQQRSYPSRQSVTMWVEYRINATQQRNCDQTPHARAHTRARVRLSSRHTHCSYRATQWPQNDLCIECA